MTPRTHGCIRAGAALLLGTASLAFAQVAPAPHACLASPTMLQMISNPLIANTIMSRTEAHPDVPNADGATPLTQKWLNGTDKQWFVENQRAGAEDIEAGVVMKNHKLVADGLHELEYAFTRQDPKTGGFPESDDAFHSVTVFLIDAERALISLKEAQPEFKELQPRAEALLPHLHAAAEWMLRPDVLALGKKNDNPFTHRRWIAAAVLGIAGQLTGDPKLTAAAKDFAREGIALQHEDGLNPERGGFDVSYEMVDALQGARYYTTLNCGSDAALMQAVAHAMEKTCQWEMTHLLPSGLVDVEGSTRMLKETDRSGKIKHINYKEVVEAFTYTSMITRDPQYLGVAQKMAAGVWDSKK